jgi:hypothetical protein
VIASRLSEDPARLGVERRDCIGHEGRGRFHFFCADTRTIATGGAISANSAAR